MKDLNQLFLAILIMNISCQSKDFDNAILISEVKSVETVTPLMSIRTYLKLISNSDSSAVGEYGSFFEDLAILLELNSDYTYCLKKNGLINEAQVGNWEIRNDFLFLKRKMSQPYYRLLEIDSDQRTSLTVYDIETGNIVMCLFQTQTLWYSKKNYSDSLTIIPSSTKRLVISNLEYQTVSIKIANLKKKRIEVFLSKTVPFFTNDSIKVYSDRLQVSNSLVFNKLN